MESFPLHLQGGLSQPWVTLPGRKNLTRWDSMEVLASVGTLGNAAIGFSAQDSPIQQR